MSARSLPVADARSFAGAARRTRRLRVALLGALAMLGTAAVLVTRGGPAGPDILPAGGSTVVVIDLSGSTRAASRQIARSLLGLTRNGSREIGLVVFSDTAYEALPLAAPADALRSWLALLATGSAADYPWTPSFSGGTVISGGLQVARLMLAARPPGARHVLLVSDLVDGIVDLPRLQTVVAEYQRERIDLRVISVAAQRRDGAASNASFLQTPNAPFVSEAAARTLDVSALGARARSAAPLLALVGALALVAALLELLLHPLVWRAR